MVTIGGAFSVFPGALLACHGFGFFGGFFLFLGVLDGRDVTRSIVVSKVLPR